MSLKFCFVSWRNASNLTALSIEECTGLFSEVVLLRITAIKTIHIRFFYTLNNKIGHLSAYRGMFFKQSFEISFVIIYCIFLEKFIENICIMSIFYFDIKLRILFISRETHYIRPPTYSFSPNCNFHQILIYKPIYVPICIF